MKSILGYFYCVDSILWTVWEEKEDGKEPVHSSNFPRKFKIKGNTVLEVEDDAQGEFINEEYTLWASLTDLAIEVECTNIEPEEPNTMSLKQAVAESYLQVRDFNKSWLANAKNNPEYFPLALPIDDAGSWFEQIFDHQVEN